MLLYRNSYQSKIDIWYTIFTAKCTKKMRQSVCILKNQKEMLSRITITK
jgi:hypothetical protein